MTLTRREILLTSGVVGVAGISGCQIPLLSETPRVDIKLVNYTSDRQPVQIRILRAGRDEYNDAEVFARELDVPAPADDDSAGTLEQQDIVKRRRYILRVRPKFGNGEWHHYHYYPGESTTDENGDSFDIRLYRNESTGDVYPRFFM